MSSASVTSWVAGGVSWKRSWEYGTFWVVGQSGSIPSSETESLITTSSESASWNCGGVNILGLITLRTTSDMITSDDAADDDADYGGIPDIPGM